MKRFSLLCLLVISHLYQAQIQGKQRYEQFGIEFTLPAGWYGQEGESSIMIRHEEHPTVIGMLSLHENNLEELLTEVRAGLKDENGTDMNLNTEPEIVGGKRINASFHGVIEFQSCEAYYRGMVNPKGYGVSMIGIGFYGTELDVALKLAEEVTESVSFFSPKVEQTQRSAQNNSSDEVPVASNAKEWRQQLGGSRLTFRESYYSGGTSSGGYNLRRQIDLCKPGYFNFEGSSLVSGGNSNVNGYSSGSSAGAGSWEVQQKGSASYLILNFNDGSVSELKIEYIDKKLYLSGERYFWTWSGEFAPYCPE